jgi:flagellar motor component MotA
MVLVAELCSMANKAKRNGLLSLVQEADETSHFLLRKGLQLVLEGVNPQMVEKTFQYYILSGKYHGKELLARCIIMEGILAIQNGVNPTIIRELLLSLFGESTPQLFESCCYLYSAKAVMNPMISNSAMEKITASNPFLIKSNNPELQHR